MCAQFINSDYAESFQTISFSNSVIWFVCNTICFHPLKLHVAKEIFEIVLNVGLNYTLGKHSNFKCLMIQILKYRVRIRVMVSNPTFNKISVVSLRPIVLVEETDLQQVNDKPHMIKYIKQV